MLQHFNMVIKNIKKAHVFPMTSNPMVNLITYNSYNNGFMISSISNIKTQVSSINVF